MAKDIDQELLRKTVINNIVELSDRMNKFAYEQGITEDIVQEIINYRK
jgi:hypothetical protein